MPLKHNSEPRRDEMEPLEKVDPPLVDDSPDETGKSWDADLERWLQEVRADDFSYVSTLYRFRDQKLWVIDEFKDYVPSAHQIGMDHGGGSYRIYVHIPICKEYPKGTVKTKRISIDPESYRKKRIEAGIIPETALQQYQPNNPAESRREIFDMLSSFSEMMRKFQPANVAAPVPSSVDAFQQYAVLQEVLKKNLFDNIEMQKQLTEKFMKQPIPESGAAVKPENDADESDAEPEEKEGMITTILAKVLPLLDRFLPLLTGNSPQSKVAIEILRQQPEYQALLKDNLYMKKMISEIKQRAGIEKTRKVLSNLKLDDQGRPLAGRPDPRPDPRRVARPTGRPQIAQVRKEMKQVKKVNRKLVTA